MTAMRLYRSHQPPSSRETEGVEEECNLHALTDGNAALSEPQEQRDRMGERRGRGTAEEENATTTSFVRCWVPHQMASRWKDQQRRKGRSPPRLQRLPNCSSPLTPIPGQ